MSEPECSDPAPLFGDAERSDPLRRLTRTPYSAHLQLMQRAVRLETNDPQAIDFALKFFYRHPQEVAKREPDFLWRIVYESDTRVQPTGSPVSALSSGGIRYATTGHGGFIAVDLNRRQATAYLSNPFLDWDPASTHRAPFDLLFSLCSASLGLTVLAGGCVGSNGQAVMIFGSPNSGKTTACYLAAKMQMEFYADQAVFLDTSSGELRAWGDFLPAVFRPEAVKFLPEMGEATNLSTYTDLSFRFFDKRPLQSRWAHSVGPACSLFLERGVTSTPILTNISGEDAAFRLRESVVFEEEPRFDRQISAAVQALAAKPAYVLKYDHDPKTAAVFIRKMLS